MLLLPRADKVDTERYLLISFTCEIATGCGRPPSGRRLGRRAVGLVAQPVSRTSRITFPGRVNSNMNKATWFVRSSKRVRLNDARNKDMRKGSFPQAPLATYSVAINREDRQCSGTSHCDLHRSSRKQLLLTAALQSFSTAHITTRYTALGSRL